MALFMTLTVLGMVLWGLERNKDGKGVLVGSTDVQDRDRERLNVDLIRRA